MNYKKLYFLIKSFLLVLITTISWKPVFSASPNMEVLISTDFGQMKIKLYDDTPVHRDNFVKLVQQGYFDGLTFYRVLQHFAIQGGNPNDSITGTILGLDTLSAEIRNQHFHKKGALAAGRKNDYENPTKASSPLQFYIVHGDTYNEAMLENAARRITKNNLFNNIINRKENEALKKKYQAYSKQENLVGLKDINIQLMKMVELELPHTIQYTFSENQLKAYTSIGGVPHLDNSYTVFGEVYQGLEIIDKIAKQAVEKDGKPIAEIHFKISIIN